MGTSHETNHAQRSRRLTYSVVIILLSTTIATPQDPNQGRPTVLVGGRVVDANSGASLPGVQLILQFNSSNPPQTTYSNAKGAYTLSVTTTSGLRGASITATTTNYKQAKLTITNTNTLDEFDLLLEPTIRAPQIGNGTKASDNVPSGIGANWSGWYQVCTDPLQPNQRIGSNIAFELTGDRRCGGWAECRETLRTPQQVCWQFRLQGHSESFPPRPAFSRGILHYTIEQAPAGANGTKGIVYVQIVREALRPFANKLVDGLSNAGYAAPGTQHVTGKYRNELRYFHPRDKERADMLTTLAVQLLRDAGHPTTINTVFVDGYEASANFQQFEIWIND